MKQAVFTEHLCFCWRDASGADGVYGGGAGTSGGLVDGEYNA